uniref:Uncharacterized protein n=1 Tax=Clastoptera arizonana TaxID=38151 RepID=A0A1B6BW36_9HEMI
MDKWPVERYSQWRNKMWIEKQLSKDKCIAFIKNAEFILLNNETVLENINLSGESGFVKSSYSEDNLGILLKKENTISKFRIKFGKNKTTSSINNCLACVSEIRKYLPVKDINANKIQSLEHNSDKLETVHGIALKLLKEEIESESIDNSILLPEDFPLEDFIVQTILDPELNNIVSKIEKSFRKLSFKRTNN